MEDEDCCTLNAIFVLYTPFPMRYSFTMDDGDNRMMRTIVLKRYIRIVYDFPYDIQFTMEIGLAISRNDCEIAKSIMAKNPPPTKEKEENEWQTTPIY